MNLHLEVSESELQAAADGFAKRLGLPTVIKVCVRAQLTNTETGGYIVASSQTDPRHAVADIQIATDSFLFEGQAIASPTMIVAHEVAHVLLDPLQDAYEAMCNQAVLSDAHRETVRQLWSLAEERVADGIALALTGERPQPVVPERTEVRGWRKVKP
jgi:hypothetical protein